MQETVVYLKKITQPEGEKKELERELSQSSLVANGIFGVPSSM